MISSFLAEAGELLPAAPGTLILDARKAEAYAKGHIPGAVHLATYDIFVPGTRPAELAAFRTELARHFGAAGVHPGRPVVVYEDETGMRAARELWILEYLGHPDARMLHGGLRAWLAAGGTLSTEPATPTAAHFAPGEVTRAVISAEEIHAAAGKLRLLDVRNATEYAGKDNTACCARRGRLPGAHWLEWTELLDAASGRFKPPAAIRAELERRGLAPAADETLVPYCHRGARSANTYYALRHAGYANVRNYIGSFHDWSARAELPLEI